METSKRDASTEVWGRHMVNNYRPISVIPVIAKVFESMVHGQLYEYLGRNKILSEEQTGFRPNRSTQDALLRAIDDWKSALDSGQIIAAVMIDLSKAFDSINYNLLLKKLHAYGVQGVELAWFSNYLTERKQRVVMEFLHSGLRSQLAFHRVLFLDPCYL